MIGVYFIYNIVTNKVYIGQSNNPKKRFVQHKYKLKNNKHHCQHLQKSWDLHKEYNFHFFIVYECQNQDEANFIEKYYIDWYNCLGLAYNTTWNHKGRGEVSLETREKLRQANLGKKATIETRLKLSANNKGRKMPNHVKENLVTTNSKSFKVVSPDNIIFEGLNRTQFCKQHNLNIACFNEMILGNRTHHRGWRLNENVITRAIGPFLIKNPDGDIIERNTINEFCDEFGLVRQHLYKLIKGKINQYKGWTLI